jgi:predicted dienelactone hydrolase
VIPRGAAALTDGVATRQGAAVRTLPILAFITIARVATGADDYTTPGPFPIGFTTVDLTKTSVTTGEPRLLATLVWYPAVGGTGTVEGRYLRDADVAKGRFPVVVFSHGSCGFPGQSPFLMEALASRGFILAAPPHPGNTFTADCFQSSNLADAAQNRPADVIFVADSFVAFGRDAASRFHRRVKPKRLGVSGHSFGGYTTLRVAAADRRFKAALALAPAVPAEQEQVRSPLMVMVGEVDSLTPVDTDAVPSYGLGIGHRYLVEILRTGHCAFIPLCAEQFCGAGCEPQHLTTPEANALVLRYAVPFLLRYLKGDRAAGKGLRPDQAPEGVVVEAVTRKPRGPLY